MAKLKIVEVEIVFRREILRRIFKKLIFNSGHISGKEKCLNYE
jgi:hypothetical protein